MIHYNAISRIEDRLREINSLLECGFSAEVETNLYQEQRELNDEVERLRAEQEEYRDGYEAGQQFHMDGVPMKDEWLGRSDMFHQGFTSAGEDS